MKGKFNAYVLWPLAKRVQNLIVNRYTARDFTVYEKYFCEIIYRQNPNSVKSAPRNFTADGMLVDLEAKAGITFQFFSK